VRRSAVDAFDEDAEPFDLKDDRDLDAADDSDDEFFDDDLEDAGEDDIDLVVAVYREDGKATAVPLDYDLANDLEELIRQLGRLRPSARGVMVGKRESCQSRLTNKRN